jgi:hypothetical protein
VRLASSPMSSSCAQTWSAANSVFLSVTLEAMASGCGPHIIVAPAGSPDERIVWAGAGGCKGLRGLRPLRWRGHFTVAPARWPAHEDPQLFRAARHRNLALESTGLVAGGALGRATDVKGAGLGNLPTTEHALRTVRAAAPPTLRRSRFGVLRRGGRLAGNLHFGVRARRGGVHGRDNPFDVQA